MSLKQTMTVFELLDSAYVNGKAVVELFKDFAGVKASYQTVKETKASTDCITILIPGSDGKSKGGNAPTLGIVGRLGGIGARPSRIGLVSDADGAVAAISSALKLAQMQENGDVLPGDVLVTTQICPNAPTQPHEPVDFMGAPIDMATTNKYEVLPEMEAILSIDTTKGNHFLNHKGYAISCTIKDGWILRLSEDLIRIMEMTSGKPAVTFPVSMQDITPYGNDIYHINSIVQPCTATTAPVVGVAICTETPVPGCSTGASHEVDIALAVKFAVEVAKEYTRKTMTFYDETEFAKLQKQYGSMKHLLTK
ncbi:MAG: DUF1177 domain-containing protein [Deferribacteraceae bacterium]|jgi:hypothetical protein|nr:DUF1177 domain-containing protein [Deferribacteraceae bacterium]